MALCFLVSVKRAALWEPWLLVLAILSGCVSLGLLFEGKRRLWALEAVRLLALAGLALGWGLWLVPAQWLLGVLLAGLCAASLVWLVWLAARPQVAAAS
ncbi:hypothetical protein D3C84_990570 [compost metagenome]